MQKSKQASTQCLGVFTPTMLDAQMCTLWTPGRMQNDITLTAHALALHSCLGVFFTEVDYTYFPCCSSLWCIIHLIELITKPYLLYLITDLDKSDSTCWVAFARNPLWSWKPLPECTLHNSTSGGDSVLVTTKDKHDINTQSRSKVIYCTLETVCVSLSLFAHCVS